MEENVYTTTQEVQNRHWTEGGFPVLSTILTLLVASFHDVARNTCPRVLCLDGCPRLPCSKEKTQHIDGA